MLMTTSPKNLKVLALALSMLLLNVLPAKNLGLAVSYHQFNTAQGKSYIEVLFALNSASLQYLKTDSVFNGGVEIMTYFYKDSALANGGKFRILSPNYSDTLQLGEPLLHLERYFLENGQYRMELHIKDINNPQEQYVVEENITVQWSKDEPQASEIQLLSSYEKNEGAKTAFTKLGLEMMPRINQGTPYLPKGESKLSFYLELYNLPEKLGMDSLFLLKHFLTDANGNTAMEGYGSFAKRKARPVVTMLSAYNIAKLPTGNYQLKVEVYSKKMEQVLEKNLFFYRRNEQSKSLEQMLTEVETNEVEMDDPNVRNFDSLYQYIKYLYPISNDAQRRFQKQLLADEDMSEMQRYFYSFWLLQNKAQPEKAWQEYHHKVKRANKSFSTRLHKGYLTDRGRIFLTYGAPYQKVQRQIEPTVPPYEIWQYDRIDSKYSVSQNNRVFVFAEYSTSTNDYQLIHSDAVGEMSNPRWRNELIKRGNGNAPSSIDATGVGAGSPYGTRTDNSIILGNPGSGNLR